MQISRINILNTNNKQNKTQNKNINFGIRIHPERVRDKILREDKDGFIKALIFLKGTNKLSTICHERLKGVNKISSITHLSPDGTRKTTKIETDYDYANLFKMDFDFTNQPKEKSIKVEKEYINKKLVWKKEEKRIEKGYQVPYLTIMTTEYYPDGKTPKIVTKAELTRHQIQKTNLTKTVFSPTGAREIQHQTEGNYWRTTLYDTIGEKIHSSINYNLPFDGMIQWPL